MDDVSKTRGINNQILRLGCCLPPYQNSWLRAWLASPPFLFERPISLYSPSINYRVYPLESFTLSPFDKMLVSWYSKFVLIHVFMGIHENINNNQADLKH